MNRIVSSEEFYDALADDYDQWFETDKNTLQRSVEKELLEYCLTGCKKILDLACGTGRTLELLSTKFDMTGVDISSKMLQKSRYRSRLVRASAFELPFMEGSFDAVISIFAGFAYSKTLDEVKKLLEETSRILRTGGVILLDSPNLYDDSEYIDKNERLIIMSKKGLATKYYIYNKDGIANIAYKAGYKIEAIFGNYDRSLYNSFSRRLILFARKVVT